MSVIRALVIGFCLSLLAGCQVDRSFPEDQRLDGPISIGPEWQTITFKAPLKVNREAVQQIEIVVDSNLFKSNFAYEDEDRYKMFHLRRNDGVVIKPEAILIGDNGQKIPLVPDSTTALYSGGVTAGLSMFEGWDSPPPPFPEEIQHFTAVQLRTNETIPVEQLRWWVTYHPDYHRCGRQRCMWWDNLLQGKVWE